MLGRDGLQSGVREPCFKRTNGSGIASERTVGEGVDVVERNPHSSTVAILRTSGGVEQALLLEVARAEAFEFHREAAAQFLRRGGGVAVEDGFELQSVHDALRRRRRY